MPVTFRRAFFGFYLNCIVLLIFVLHCSIQVSFYGASYVKLPVQDASSSTNIYIRFKTYRSDAILLLAAGTTDYCLVTLQDGSVKVRMNLGAGETEISSPQGIRLDDLSWHEIEIQRDDAEISLIVDAIHTTHHFIPGSFYELNVNFGVYCGGLGDFSELFLGNLNNFRGCMDEVSFNDYDILSATEGAQPHLVTWDCSDEFSGIEEYTISFMDTGAYMALPQMSARTGGSINFDIKTQSQTAVLVYHSGIPSKSDFVALELINGAAQLLINKGNGVVPVVSNVTISDGYWHNVDVSFGPDELDLTVDSVNVNVRISQRGSKFMDLNGYLYIGGIEINKQSMALRQGLESVDQEGTESSMRGCIKNLKVNRETTGLLEAEVTQGLRSGCVWEYPCLQSPCISGAECYQESYDGFRCFCEAGEMCIRKDYNETYAVYTKSTLPVDMEILYLHPLQVQEGGSELLTTDLIDVTLDYQRYGVGEAGVRFHIVDAPKYGNLEVEIWRRSNENFFTLFDLSTDKIRYNHFGSDEHHDTITFEIEFVAHSHRLPPFLEYNNKFIFHINVLPVNDPPRLVIPPNKVLTLASGTKKLITSEYLDAKDTDTPPSELIFLVVKFRTSGAGYIENVKNPGESIAEFTQQDVNNALISYVHEGPEDNGRVAFKISDGKEDGDIAVLKIATFELFISLANNTGLKVTHGTYSKISSVNLTFITNAIDQQLDISYDITRMPEHGIIQKLKSSGRWQITSRFTQRQINNGHIRYEHAGNSKPKIDKFKFVVSSSSKKQSNVYEFLITFTTVEVEISGSKFMKLQHINEAKLTPGILNVRTDPDVSDKSTIGFHLITTPTHGEVFVKGHNGEMLARKPYGEDYAFTLQDILEGNVIYRLKWQMFFSINDSFKLMASTPGGIKNDLLIRIVHNPEPSPIKVNIKPTTVSEGGRVVISSENLQVIEPGVRSFLFNITESPKHGYLLILNNLKRASEVIKPEVISSGHINDGRLLYVHDNTENSEDHFSFVAFAGEWSKSETRIHGTLKIKVGMINDNPPYRVVDRPFYVVKSGQRIITANDILYKDKDINTKSNDIHFKRKGIESGMMVSVDNPLTQIYQFTQKDINNGNIVFKHFGDAEDRAVLWVTDGEFYITGILEINATAPFIHVEKNVAPIVKHGDSAVIDSSKLSTITNVDGRLEKLVYSITKPTKYGQVTRRGISVLQFTQEDVSRGWIEYENDNVLEFVDFFDFEVSVGSGVSEKGQFKIKIYPESYWSHLRVDVNKTLNVLEGKSKLINRSVLEITHSNVDPREIKYEVVSPPKHGALFVRNYKHVTKFTQEMINDQTLKYEQTSKNSTSDIIVMNVTNGVITLVNFTFPIRIIPSRVELIPSLVTVLEGNKLALEPNHFSVRNQFYRNSVRDYLITTLPKYGRLQNKRKPKKRITRFSPTQLRRGLIYYLHDGSETKKDRFSVVAVVTTETGLIRSSPGHVDVAILPVDDQPPHLINNTGLTMWSGLSITLTNEMLAAEDVDSLTSDINFRITKSDDIGYFGLISNPDQFLTILPQSKINAGEVNFYHTDGERGSYIFELTDKVNTQKDLVTFNIFAKPIKLTVGNKKQLQVFPKMPAVIKQDNLQVVASGDISPEDIIYEVIKAPKYGKLLVKHGQIFNHVTEFSQDELDKNLILYESTGSQYVNDSVDFVVSNEYSKKSIRITLPIEISSKLAKDNLFGVIKPIEVTEGGTAIISEVNLNITALLLLVPSTSSRYSLKDFRIVVENQPQHGDILCRGKKVIEGGEPCEVSLKELGNGRLRYQHDHSDTFFDSVDVTLKLKEIANSDFQLVNITLEIKLIPVNDNDFELKTTAPKIEVVFGMKTKLTPDHFFTKDPDGIPGDIVYEVISGPGNGRLVKAQNGRNIVTKRFSQEDINKGRVFFVHDRRSSDNGMMNIKVWDGNPDHSPVFKGCATNVLPLTLTILENLAVKIPQGTTAVVLTPEHLNVSTNGNRTNTLYHVENVPNFGELVIDGEVVTKFKQSDMDNGRVMYFQNDLSGYEDHFSFTVSNSIAKLTDQIVRLKVVPMLKQQKVPVSFAVNTFISLNYLDASKLARQTDSNPMYSILVPPKFGSIQRIKQRPYRSTESIKSFTHSDIKNNFIYYKSLPSEDKYVKTENIEFLLSASNVQPAKGNLELKVNPKIPIEDNKETDNNSSPSKEPNGGEDVVKEDSGSGIEIDYVIIILVVVSLLVIIVIGFIVIVRCLKKSKPRKGGSYQKNFKKSGKNGVSDDLPPPPSTITPPVGKLKRKQFSGSSTPPPIGMYSIDDDFAEISAAVPMCKVTPLNDHHIPSDCHNIMKPQYDDPDSLYSDDLSTNSFNETQWSNHGQQETQFSPPSNPLLRKNQYWV